MSQEMEAKLAAEKEKASKVTQSSLAFWCCGVLVLWNEVYLFAP